MKVDLRRLPYPAAVLPTMALRQRARAAWFHLLVSAAVAAVAAVLVFAVWYPGPYRLLAGGRELFVLVSVVDVVIGPLLTLAVFDPRKSWRHLRTDLVIIAALQLGALGYGLHTVYAARPLAMVFEVDRFRLITASNVSLEDLAKAAPEYRKLGMDGPQVLGTRRPQLGEERNDALFKGLEGVDIGARPIFWQPYEQSRNDAIARSRPLSKLLERYPSRRTEIREGLSGMDIPEAGARFLPVMARGDWVAVLDPTGSVVGYLPFDGFF